MIRVLLFAELEERAGKRELELNSNEMSVAAIRDWVKDNYPDAAGIDRAMAAVNEDYAEESTLVHADDIIAFIPPVSGG
ncbi:molybdopterin converting factor subunit 1 [Salisediminibacterium beveridgei]|uniref:Molybdopterin synthase sulfur carrier subunit n=1 Tax=Salisediminibacterium beveridgei TaxID=632773 RepID=A0A1D7QWK5_9BACI|nr:molybdopterin converting factor subunit 1 [Salisediminibacterium beveridgei]AOM83394.1 Molybdopterin synthase sulfur carrier subunit [Salisediminibacterium beveridgei]